MKKTFSTLFTKIFGQFNWDKPSWLRQSRAKTICMGGLLFLILIACAFSIYWYQQRALQDYVRAFIKTPNITPNEERLVPQPLIINFGLQKKEFEAKSVAPLDLIGKTITKGIHMVPNIQGQWIWISDSQLEFRPSEDWPAAKEYHIQFSKDFFAENVKMQTHSYYFKTKDLEGKISEFKLYQDPTKGDVREAVATIHFNFPINPTSLETHTNLCFEQLNNKHECIKDFRYTFDKHKRVAYLHSSQINIQNTARYLQLSLNKEVSSATGPHLKERLRKNLLIPDASNFLKILSAKATIVRNNNDKPQQLLMFETSIGVSETEFNQHVQVGLLPLNYPATSREKEKVNYQWTNPLEITDAILPLITPLAKERLPSEHNYTTLQSYKFLAKSPRYLYIQIKKGMKGLGGFVLRNNYTAIVPVPQFPKEISFLHKGSLLALSGDKKFSVLVRGLPAVKFDFARVLPAYLCQLVSQTQGDFNNPTFINPNFNEQNISKIYTEIQQFDNSDPSKQQYTALDLSRYLNKNINGLGPRGLFLLQANGYDPVNKITLDLRSSRLLLITDLGLLVKDNNDGTHEVFVQSITQGLPIEHAKISILGKNGLPILSAQTDNQGRASFPNLKDFVEDREPTVYLASLGDDVSFIPYRNDSRQLNFSKFDVGGNYTANSQLQNLRAYLFSERGVYRPGDKVHVGMIIKEAFSQSLPPGLPLQASVYDSRGTTIKEETFVLNKSGLLELNFTTSLNSPTGIYRVDLSLMKNELPQTLLGSVNIHLAEFQPDRMHISTSLLPKETTGWSSPKGLKESVKLMNLYGAPAANRRIATKILLTPEKVAFKEYPDYIFADPLIDPKKPAKTFTETLNDTKTNEQGEAIIDLDLSRFAQASYQLTIFNEGFEAEGGRSVISQTKALISPLAYFVGYKPDGDLGFIKQNDHREIHYIALSPQLNKKRLDNLKVQLDSLHPVTTLVKKPDGTYQYQSIMQSSIINTQPFLIEESGSSYILPTKHIGDYSLSILDNNGTILSQLKFSVVGESQRPLAKNAQLNIKLNRSQFEANEDIQLQITAPYTGSGLITIERDKVYAVKWFKTDTTNFMESIHIPSDFQGNGYVNVAFIRDWASPELFISPLSYAVEPFDVSHEHHNIDISLNALKEARPGQPLEIAYHTNKPSKIIIFAVDEGILQVSHFKTPDPLAFFFQKNALEVATQQTVDQILPKFILDRELSAAGGDGMAEELDTHLNPFKRKTDLPVVFWSGILNANENNQKITYHVPDYFNGSLRIMAVAVSSDAVGSKETTSKIRGDFIISPNVPTFVSPQDSFEISASIANNMKHSGENTVVNIELSHSPGLELLEKANQTLKISEGKEQVVHYKLRANSKLGSAKIELKATAGNRTSAMSSTVSIRPAVPLVTYVNSGMTNLTKSLDIVQSFYWQFRNVQATISSSPLSLVFGLERYLENFPYGCTEQIISKAMPLIAMNSQSWLSKNSKKISEKIISTIQLLGQRQMSSGAFSYWPGLEEHADNTFSSVYAMHFLTLAKAQGFNVPSDLFYTGISYLKELAGLNPKDKNSARIQAYAIYVLTTNDIVTSNYLANLLLYLQQDRTNSWEQEITGSYIAATYQLLKSDDEANQIVGRFKIQKQQLHHDNFFDNQTSNAQYLYILSKHFPGKLDPLGNQLLESIVHDLNNNEINTLFSAYSALALAAFNEQRPANSLPNLSMSVTTLDNRSQTFPAQNTAYQKEELGLNVKQIHFNSPKKESYFYQLVQTGFDKAQADKPLKEGLEIYREYRDINKTVVNSTHLGAEIEVHLQIRALNHVSLSNIAIVDLLPGGFEVVKDSIKAESMDFYDVREDRVNFFGSVDSTSKEIVYKIKATNQGKYQVPPAYAQAMYNPSTKARGESSEITVTQ